MDDLTGAADLPAATAVLTPGFFEDALASSLGAGGRVLKAECRPVTDNRGFVGETLRCSITYEGPYGRPPPSSIVAKLPSRNPDHRRLFGAFALYRREIGFYRELQSSTPIPTPECFATNWATATGDFILLLQDLSPARTGDRAGGLTPDQAALAVEAAARMHARWWMDPALTRLDWLPAPATQHLGESPAVTYRRIWPSFEKRMGDQLPKPIRALGRDLTNSLPLVLDRLAGPPWTLVHGDYQLGNIFFTPQSIAGVVDWQMVMRARGALDITHLLVRSLDPRERRIHEDELLEIYHSGLAAGGVEAYPFEECREDYRLALICEFALGLILDSLLPAGSARDAKANSDFESLSEIGTLRFFAALADLDWQATLSALRRPGWRARLKARTRGR